MEFKTCTKCGETRPTTEFYKQSRSSDGLNPWCKECYRQWHIGRYTPKAEAPSSPFCAHCGSAYEPKQRRPSSYCSRKCKDDARHAAEAAALVESKPERSCVHCGSALPKSMRVDAKFCSSSCNSAAHQVTRKMAKRAGVDRPDELVSRAYIAERDGWRCGLCGGRVSRARKHPDPLCASIDHIVPVAAGGTNDLANLQLAHLRCNLVKRDRGTDQLRFIG